jgi:CTP synthase
VHVTIRWVDTETLANALDAAQALADVDAVIVPGGFGNRGVDGKLAVIEHCRAHDIPFLGICYGMQLAVVEFARSVCGLTDAHTTEIDANTKHPVVTILPGQVGVTRKGGTMRLGGYDAVIARDTKVHELYGDSARERHRHRYEVNPDYHAQLTARGLMLSGLSPNGTLAEFIELPSHPYFVATQGHPELRSSLDAPAPLFVGLVQAALARREVTVDQR